MLNVVGSPYACFSNLRTSSCCLSHHISCEIFLATVLVSGENLIKLTSFLPCTQVPWSGSQLNFGSHRGRLIRVQSRSNLGQMQIKLNYQPCQAGSMVWLTVCLHHSRIMMYTYSGERGTTCGVKTIQVPWSCHIIVLFYCEFENLELSPYQAKTNKQNY